MKYLTCHSFLIAFVVLATTTTTNAFSPKNPAIKSRTQPPAFIKEDGSSSESGANTVGSDTISSVTGNTQTGSSSISSNAPTKAFHRTFQFQKGTETRLQQTMRETEGDTTNDEEEYAVSKKGSFNNNRFIR
mmetsp:Transcript_16693/g.23539  ORF Transcript_16693/g.23539 Transcript_16693/m.23539 type:complete len:132 (+) Transcript_16693:155-550(+)